jgi:hypothetical protein
VTSKKKQKRYPEFRKLIGILGSSLSRNEKTQNYVD